MTPRDRAANAQSLKQYAAFVRAYRDVAPQELEMSPIARERKANLAAEFQVDLVANCAELIANIAESGKLHPDGINYVATERMGETNANETIQSSDGPVSPDGIRYRGKLYRGLQPKPWRFLSFLWEQPDRVSHLDDVVAHVMEETDPVYESEPHGWRKRLNIFFRENDVPFHATVRSKLRQAAILDGLPATARTKPS